MAQVILKVDLSPEAMLSLTDLGGGGGGSGANLAWVAATSTVTSDTGTDATLTLADITNPGLAPALSGVATEYLGGTGSYSSPFPSAFVFSDAGAGGIKSLLIDPVFPGVGNTAKHGVVVGPAAGGTPDEAINIGYNVGAVTVGEPTAVYTQEVNYVATARGLASQRVMESYQQFSNEDTNAPRNFFTAFEPGDTTSVSGETGQILYSYISTGFNRTGTAGGGGLSIGMDWNGSAGGAGGLDTLGYAFVDVDGPRMVQLRSCDRIKTISGATVANPCVITVSSGHGFNIGAKIQIFKPDANGMMERDWNAGSPVVGLVTALPSATQITLTGVNNTSLGIVSGYGFQMARPTATAYAPAFQFLSVGTSSTSAVPFTFYCAGSAGFTDGIRVSSSDRITSSGADLSPGDFRDSPVSYSGGAPTASGRRQIITAQNTNRGWSIGFADDPSGENSDDFICAIGRSQTTDSSFTIANTALAIFCGDGTSQTVAVGGALPSYNTAYFKVAPGTSALAQINLVSSTLKTTPVVGDFSFDGTNPRFCVSAGVWGTLLTQANLTYTAATRALNIDTGTDVTLPLFTSTEAGLVPLSGGGTSNFLRADGTWAAPAGGSGLTSPQVLARTLGA